MRVLVLCLAVLAACGRRTPTTGPSTPPLAALDATVVGPDGPVAGARVRMLALPPAPCPCKESGLPADHYYGNEMPTCACPAALAQWRSRLAECDIARGFVAEVNSGLDGKLRLEPSRGVTSLEAIGPAGLLWMRWPSANGPIALALDDAEVPTIKIAGAPRDLIRGAVLFDDGHCVPIDPVADGWKPRVPIPRFEVAGGTLVLEARGYATTLYSLFDQEVVDIEMAPATPITGTCEGTRVTFENPFQRIAAKVDDRQQFAIDGALAMNGTVSCWKGQTLVDEWSYTPGQPLDSTAYGSYSSGPPCSEVMVVDAHELPVADAEVSFSDGHSGTSSSTDARGIACLWDVDVGGTVEVTAPQGRCAGEASMKLTQRHLAQSPIKMRLRIKPLKGTPLRGRVIDPDGSPVVGAGVTVKYVTPSDPDACADSVAAAGSSLDGTFSLASLPRGKVVLEVEHKWFAKREITVEHDNSTHDLVLPRGGRWTGRLLDPEGDPINDCSLFVDLADGRMIHTKCNAGSFDLKPIVAGEAKLHVRVEDHALGTFRSLKTKVVLDASVRNADIQFPRGEHISGRIVDKDGRPIPRGRLAAIPAGSSRPPNRLHDQEVQIEADASGTFTFRHLAPGTWTLNGVGFTHTQKTIDVKTGTTDATFIVPAKK